MDRRKGGCQRLYAEIIESDPVEPSRFRFNNATETRGPWSTVVWSALVMESTITPTETSTLPSSEVSVSNPSPRPGEATTFTVTANNERYDGRYIRTYFRGIRSQTQDHSMLEVQVEISLSPGLSFAVTQPDPPSGTTFNTTTGIWNVGILQSGLEPCDQSAIQVAVNLTADSLEDLPLEERCLTVELDRVDAPVRLGPLEAVERHRTPHAWARRRKWC